MKAEEFPWGEFLRVRAKLIVWLRHYGDEGEPMSYERIAGILSCDPEQVKLIRMAAEDL